LLKTEIAIIGGGPAGMTAAIAAAGEGASVTLIDRSKLLGGQLVKQTHRFFGSEKEHAGTRGIQIVDLLKTEIEKNPRIEVKTDTTVLGIYDDGVMTLEEGSTYKKLTAQRTIITTGAAEKMLTFPNNDLPGVMGAGAVQTLMNQYGVIPGSKVLMIGAGNIGLIVSYQLMQAGVKVAAIIEAAPRIGGYRVHAAKIQRLGVPILTSHTIKHAFGRGSVKGAFIYQLDDNWNEVPGTEKELDVDVICLAVGLSPLVELLWHTGCEMKYIPQLGGYVPIKDENLETSKKGVFVAGDVSGVEEASSAMLEGKIAGLSAAESLGYAKNVNQLRLESLQELEVLRSGKSGTKIREGLRMLVG